MTLLLIYILIFISSYFFYRLLEKNTTNNKNLNSHKTISFGDESTVRANRLASFISILVLFLLWGAFTNSNLTPFHVSPPFSGDTSFTYTAINSQKQTASATVYIHVNPVGERAKKPTLKNSNNSFAKDDAIKVQAWRSVLIRPQKNDIGGRNKSYRIIAINKQAIKSGQSLNIADGKLSMTSKGSLSFVPDKGLQMEAVWLPSPEAVFKRFIEVARDGYQNVSLFENIGWSLLRVLVGFSLGCLVGIPLGYAMGLNGWFRGWFDPIVEFMRPVPPLALIPLIIIWFGIWETGKISLLFLAALWIMTISARAGVSGINIAKVHAAYSLGASKFQVLKYIIIPNSLAEIFTGARVAMGICWGTVVAAELVAAQKGAGKMIIAASKFQHTDVVIMGIILIGIVGYGIDLLMRKAEKRLIPWKGRT